MHICLMKGAIIKILDNICVCPMLKAGVTTKADANCCNIFCNVSTCGPFVFTRT